MNSNWQTFKNHSFRRGKNLLPILSFGFLPLGSILSDFPGEENEWGSNKQQQEAADVWQRSEKTSKEKDHGERKTWKTRGMIEV